MSNIYIAKIIADQCYSPERGDRLCNVVVMTSYKAARTWLKEQRNYYQNALDFLKLKFRQDNRTWEYYNELGYNYKKEEFADLTREFEKRFPDISLKTFNELNWIEFTIFKVVPHKEYNQKDSIIRNHDFGKLVEKLDNICPLFDKKN